MFVVFHSDFTAELNTFKHTNLAVASVSMDIEAATGFLQKIPGEIFSSYQAPQQNTLSTCYCPPTLFLILKPILTVAPPVKMLAPPWSGWPRW